MDSKEDSAPHNFTSGAKLPPGLYLNGSSTSDGSGVPAEEGATGCGVTPSAQGLPAGLSINHNTGIVTACVMSRPGPDEKREPTDRNGPEGPDTPIIRWGK